jgi:Domain of unknown function (DUF1707)
MGTPNESFPRADVRVSDAEREQAVAELSGHFEAGRLTQEEFEDRAGRALRARTGSDLGELFADLPAYGAALAPRYGDLPADPGPGHGDLRRAGTMAVARAVIVCVVATIIAVNVLVGLGRTGLGWLVPVVILAVVFTRLARRR